MKVIVAGSRRGFAARNVFEAIDESPFAGQITEIVSGAAIGVDRDGEYYARTHQIPVKQFKPDWTLGKHAGMVRNARMADYADALVAVWDGSSRGTKHMIETMRKLNKPVHVYQR